MSEIISAKAQKCIDLAKQFGITNKLELAHMLGNFSVETQQFTKFAEDINYRYKTARATFCLQANNTASKSYAEHKRRLTAINLKQHELMAHDSDFVPQPWLFNLVYGSRMGNEDNGINDNDGFDYRGGGVSHLTGIDNHLSFLNWLHKQGKHLGLTVNQVDEFVKSEEGAYISGIWFWLNNNIGVLARKNDYVGVCHAINGGENGLKERIAETDKYKKLLGVS